MAFEAKEMILFLAFASSFLAFAKPFLAEAARFSVRKSASELQWLFDFAGRFRDLKDKIFKATTRSSVIHLPLIETLKDLLHRVWKEERKNLQEKIEEAKSANVHSAQRVFARIGQKLHL